MQIGVRKAKDQLSRLLLRVAVGEEITITRKGVPVARLIGVPPKPGRRELGIDSGKIWMAEDFDAPMYLAEEPPRKKRKKR